MHEHPMARWSVRDKNVGASVWTREIPNEPGEGGGYYLYTWDRTSRVFAVEELTEMVSKRDLARGERSKYVTLEEIPVPDAVREADARGQELGIGRLIHADMVKRFGEIKEWITYDSFGNPVWFHDEVTGS